MPSARRRSTTPRSRFTAPGALAQYGSFHNDEHTVKAGLNYRFNLGSLGGPAYGRY
mgnify:CR=1 FL=1